ncbi:MAG: glycoside hydrolase family 3 protein, partial [Sediminibacterium sp.]|nr:glycoside hydrolase family 3 protein [Sediminibacterium sp.]
VSQGVNMFDSNYYRMKFKGLVIWMMAGVTCNLYSQNIDSLISKMTLAEKVGQMAQVDLGVLWEGETCNPKDGKVKLNEDKLRKAITEYKIGSVLNCGCGTGTHSKEEWRQWIGEIQAVAQRSGVLPILYGIDAIHGATYLQHSTLFPQQLGQAATWNPDLVQMGAAVTAYETRASGIPWNFSPVLDVARQPLWSRFFETYGSDPYLCKTMGVAAVQGYQNFSKEIVGTPFNGTQTSGAISSYNVAACLKHFMGYSAPFSGKDRTPAYFTERDLRDVFLPSFEEAIKAGAKSIMVNSGEISGIPVHASYRLLTEMLRNELRFNGVVVTDWEDIYKLHANHRVAKDYREAVKMSIMAGIDMSMIPNDFQFIDILIFLVKDGEILESRIDQSVRRILQMKKELGLFVAPMGLPSTQFSDAFSARFKQNALETALQSIT